MSLPGFDDPNYIQCPDCDNRLLVSPELLPFASIAHGPDDSHTFDIRSDPSLADPTDPETHGEGEP